MLLSRTPADHLRREYLHLPGFKDHQPLECPCVHIRLLPQDGSAQSKPIQLCYPPLVNVDRESSQLYLIVEVDSTTWSFPIISMSLPWPKKIPFSMGRKIDQKIDKTERLHRINRGVMRYSFTYSEDIFLIASSVPGTVLLETLR